MKNVLLAFLQLVVFLITFALGSFVAPLGIRQVLSVAPDGTHVFLWDGLLLMTLLFALVLLVEQARRRLRAAGAWTVGAYLLAALIGFASRFGSMTL